MARSHDKWVKYGSTKVTTSTSAWCNLEADLMHHCMKYLVPKRHVEHGIAFHDVLWTALFHDVCQLGVNKNSWADRSRTIW